MTEVVISKPNMYRLFNALCWLLNIYEGAELYEGAEHLGVYFITNIKHCITYLALTQLFPVLLTYRHHIVKYTYYVVFCCISLRSMSFCFKPWMGQINGFYWQHFFLFLQNNLGNISLITRYRCIYADQSLLFVLSTLIHKQWRLAQISVYIHVSFDHDVFMRKQCHF